MRLFDRSTNRARHIAVRRNLSQRVAQATALMTLLAAGACGGGGDGTTQTGPAATVTFSSSAFSFTAIGASQAVTATVADASGKAIGSAPVTWTSDSPAIAEVQSSGHSATIIAHAKGSTTVRATSGAATASISVTVFGVQAIAVTPANGSVRLGTTQQYAAAVTADNGVSQSVTWTTGDVAVATISATGVVTPVAVGATTVRATSSADPAVSGTTQLTVAPARGVIVTPTSATIGTQQTRALTASVTVDPGQATTVTWSSNATGIAQVNQTGVVTGVALGTATITATSTVDNTLKGTSVITVAPVVRTVVVSPPAPSLFINQTQQLTATVTADAGLAQTVTWGSSNNAIATVAANGLVTAVALGTATITATSTVDGTKTGTAAVTVAARPVSVSIAQRGISLSPGSNATLTALVTADPGVSTNVTWSSATPAVASIVSGTGVVTALTQGTTIITATSVADGTKQDTVTLSVSPRLATSWTASRLSGPMIEDIVSIYPVNATAAWAVNAVGDIYSYNGTVWTRTAQGSAFGTEFASVHGSGTTNVIAVGTNGKILRWDGTAWATMVSGVTTELTDVWVEAAGNAFAVGASGTALQLTGSTWAPTTTGSTAFLNAVWSAGGGVWFAVGRVGEILRFGANVWVRVPNSPTGDALNDVVGITAADVYAVGSQGTILHFDGNVWGVVPSGGVSADLYALAIANVGGQRVQVVGAGVAYQINGSTLVDLAPSFPVVLTTAFADQAGTLWIGGQRGLVLRGGVGAWTTLNIAPDLLDVWTTSGTNAWAVGEMGSVYQWNGTTWTRVNVPTTTRLNTVWGLGSNSAFIGGDGGLILRWDGVSWTPMTSNAITDVLSIWGTSATNVFATTFGGEVLRYNGTSWSVVQTQSSSDFGFYGVFGSSANDVYAVGDAGTVRRFDGTAWTPRNPTTTALLSSVWASGPSDVYSVGVLVDVGVAFRYTSAWQTMSGLTSPTLTSVWGTSPFDLYATGATGTVLRYNGSSWQSMTTGTTENLWAVSGAPGGSSGGFVVGANATLLTAVGTAGFTASRAASSFTPRAMLAPVAGPVQRQAYRPLPTGAARRSIRLMHAPQLAGPRARAASKAGKFGTR